MPVRASQALAALHSRVRASRSSFSRYRITSYNVCYTKLLRIANGWVDADFVRERTEDFEALKAQVADFSPDAMASVCGIDAPTLREVARRFATAGSAMILWGMGVSQHVV